MDDRDTRVRELERSWPETFALDDLTLLKEFLQFLRVTAVNKVAGLDEDDARATPLPTSPSMSVMGVIKHLTNVERFWISIVAAGRDVADPWEGTGAGDDFQLADDDTPADVVAAYRTEWARSDAASIGLRASDETKRPAGDKRRTVRWVYAHLVQETARHVGHLDLLREMADGRVGE